MSACITRLNDEPKAESLTQARRNCQQCVALLCCKHTGQCCVSPGMLLREPNWCTSTYRLLLPASVSTTKHAVTWWRVCQRVCWPHTHHAVNQRSAAVSSLHTQCGGGRTSRTRVEVCVQEGQATQQHLLWYCVGWQHGTHLATVLVANGWATV